MTLVIGFAWTPLLNESVERLAYEGEEDMACDL